MAILFTDYINKKGSDDKYKRFSTASYFLLICTIVLPFALIVRTHSK